MSWVRVVSEEGVVLLHLRNNTRTMCSFLRVALQSRDCARAGLVQVRCRIRPLHHPQVCPETAVREAAAAAAGHHGTQLGHPLGVRLCAAARGHLLGVEECPRWTYLLAGCCMLLYQTMDNLDGKQAVRTKSSSPLGEMFDHGVDALVVVLGGLALNASLQLGSSWAGIALTMIGIIPFVLATWEEYHLGALHFPIINGATEGVLLIAGLHFFSFLVGPEAWHQDAAALLGPSIPLPSFLRGVPLYTFVLLAGLISVLSTIIPNLLRVLSRNSLRGGSNASKLSSLLPFALLTLSALVWRLASPDLLVELYPRSFLLCYGLACCKLVSHLTLGHITGDLFPLFQVIVLPFPLAALHALLPEPLVDSEVLLKLVVLWTLLVYWGWVVRVVRELSGRAGFLVFSVNPDFLASLRRGGGASKK